MQRLPLKPLRLLLTPLLLRLRLRKVMQRLLLMLRLSKLDLPTKKPAQAGFFVFGLQGVPSPLTLPSPSLRSPHKWGEGNKVFPLPACGERAG
jgi:hypothetical protein